MLITLRLCASGFVISNGKPLAGIHYDDTSVHRQQTTQQVAGFRMPQDANEPLTEMPAETAGCDALTDRST